MTYSPYHYPVGDSLRECEDASADTVRIYRTLEDDKLDSTSFIDWLVDLGRLCHALDRLGLHKECRQIGQFGCQIWKLLASKSNSASVAIYSI